MKINEYDHLTFDSFSEMQTVRNLLINYGIKALREYALTEMRRLRPHRFENLKEGEEINISNLAQMKEFLLS